MTQCRAMSQALWHNVELSAAIKCQQPFQVLVCPYDPRNMIPDIT